MIEQALGHRGRLFRCLSLMPNCVELLLQEIDDDDEFDSCNISFQNLAGNPLVLFDMATSGSNEEMISLDQSY